MNISNKTILITKPEGRAQALLEQLTAMGANVVTFPTIVINSIAPTEEIIQIIKQLEHYQIIIFVSPTSVELAMPLIKKYHSTLPDNISYATVGLSTATSLMQQGVSAVIFPQTNMTSEGLLDLTALKNVVDKKILIVGGQDGRTLLQDTLIQRGAQVKKLGLYQRSKPNITDDQLLQIWQQHPIDVIISTSQESLQNLYLLLPENKRHLFKNTPLLVIDPKMKSLAIRLGHQSNIIIADNATDQAIIKRLRNEK